MDYEKAYNEAIEKIREGLQPSPDGTKISGVTREFLEELFPELKNEDEKIKKELIELISYMHDADPRKKGWLDWLEKQGATVDINPSEFEMRLNRLLKQFELLSKEDIVSSLSFYLNVIQNDGTYKAEERQGEQKPTSDIRYEGKAGDSLSVNGKPFDYEHATITQKDFAPKVDMPRYSIGDVLCDKSCTTLNKESQPNIEILDIRNGMYICNNCSFPIEQQDEYELVAKRVEPQPAWSEEDEEMTEDLIKGCVSSESPYQLTHTCKEIADWLKSLKSKLQR